MGSPRYSFSSAVAGGQPYTYCDGGSNPPYPVTVGLDQVFAPPPATLPPPAGPFSIVAGKAPYAFTISADASIWEFASAKFDSHGLFRPAVRAGFDQMLAALDGLGCLLPGRLQTIRSWIAQAIPQTFAESLYFRHGFDPVQRCVELSAGMRLRVDYEAHQDVDPGDDVRNGFVGAGSSHIELKEVAGAGGRLVLGFDPFLSRLTGLSVTPSSGGAAGAIDLQGTANQMPYWRLLYPPTVPESAGTGFTGIQQNPVLVGAPTRAVLEAATAAYVGGTALPAEAVSVWFRGRATIVPEVPVILQGQRTHVPLGTSVRDVLSGFLPVPRSASNSVSAQVCTRPFNGWENPWRPLNWSEVLLGSQPPWSPTLDTFDLPLLGGDSLWVPVQHPGN